MVVEGNEGGPDCTHSNAQDVGGQAGWSVGNSSYFRAPDSTAGWTYQGSSFLVRVNGSAKPPGPLLATNLRVGALLDLGCLEGGGTCQRL